MTIGACIEADAVAATTTVIAAGADLQAALNAAHPGDVLVLQAGARYVGPFKLAPNPVGPPITIRSSAILPERRIGPQDVALLPTLAAAVASPIWMAWAARTGGWTGSRSDTVIDGYRERSSCFRIRPTSTWTACLSSAASTEARNPRQRAKHHVDALIHLPISRGRARPARTSCLVGQTVSRPIAFPQTSVLKGTPSASAWSGRARARWSRTCSS